MLQGKQLLQRCRTTRNRTLYFSMRPGFGSASTFTTFRWSPYSFCIHSTDGSTSLHGPHHVAQKSTSTGLLACTARNPHGTVPDW